MRRLALAFLLAASVLPAFAATEVVDGITWTYIVSNGEASVGGGAYNIPAVPTATAGTITIPSTLGNCPVTSIGDYAFGYCSELTLIMIPDSVTSIGDWAFYCCSGLASITIPDGVTSIGKLRFTVVPG